MGGIPVPVKKELTTSEGNGIYDPVGGKFTRV